MKAKLVKYPFDEKKYRWDTYKLGKEFEYYWDESLPNNFRTIEPYIKIENYVYDENKDYGYIKLNESIEDNRKLNEDLEQLGYVVDKDYTYNKITPTEKLGWNENERVFIAFNDGESYYDERTFGTLNEYCRNSNQFDGTTLHYRFEPLGEEKTTTNINAYDIMYYKIVVENYNNIPVYRINFYSVSGPGPMNTDAFAWSLPIDYNVFVNKSNDPIFNESQDYFTNPFHIDNYINRINGEIDDSSHLYKNSLRGLGLRLLVENNYVNVPQIGSDSEWLAYAKNKISYVMKENDEIKELFPFPQRINCMPSNSFDPSKVDRNKINFYISTYPLRFVYNKWNKDEGEGIKYEVGVRRIFEMPYSTSNIPDYIPYRNPNVFNEYIFTQ